MKILRFIFYLIKHGSTKPLRIDFESERKILLKNISFQLPTLLNPNKKFVISLLSKSNLGHLFLMNASYLLKASRANIMFFSSSEKKLVFIRILKSASTSLLKEFLPAIEPKLIGCNLTDEEIDALSFYYVKNKLTDQESTYKKFCLVRNPFARIVSVYLDLFNVNGESFTFSNYWFGILKHDMSFKDFISAISVVPMKLLGPHFAPQYQILESAGGIQNIIYFRIEKDKKAIANFLSNHSITLAHRNKQKKTYDYVTFYDQESLKLVYQLYQKDVNVLGYQDEYELLQKSTYYSKKT